MLLIRVILDRFFTNFYKLILIDIKMDNLRVTSKKGMSTIVSTLIIILLALVAVTIVWVVIKNVFTEQTGEVSLDHFPVNLEIERVLLEESDLTISVERGAGGGELSGITFVISDGENSESFERYTNMQELGKTTFTLTPTDLIMKDIVSVEIYPVFETSSGKEKIGNRLDSFNTENLEIQTCELDCGGKECGDDGCGGSCGICDNIHECGQNVCNLITTNLIAWWKFDGDATDEIGGLDGNVEGASLTSEGRYNQAYSFSQEDDYVIVSDNSAFDISGSATIAFWIKPESIEDDQRLFYRKNWVEVKINDEEIKFKWKNGNSGDLKPKVNLDDENVWIHVVSTISGNDAKLYIDGLEADTDNDNDFDLKQSDESLYFGIKYDLNKDYEGIIDEIMIFNRALSNNEVLLLYQADLS